MVHEYGSLDQNFHLKRQRYNITSCDPDADENTVISYMWETKCSHSFHFQLLHTILKCNLPKVTSFVSFKVCVLRAIQSHCQCMAVHYIEETYSTIN